MNDVCIYHIQVRGRVAEAEINEMSPLRMVREGGDGVGTRFAVRTDQSGLIGLMRHLHGLGFVFVAVDCEQVAELAGGVGS